MHHKPSIALIAFILSYVLLVDQQVYQYVMRPVPLAQWRLRGNYSALSNDETNTVSEGKRKITILLWTKMYSE